MLPKISTYPEEWQEHCLRNGYDILDPSVKPGVLQWSPLPWDNAYKDPNTADREQRIFDEAKEVGLETGVTVPLPWSWKISPTMSFVRTGTRGLSDFAITYLHVATLLFHIKVVECLDLSRIGYYERSGSLRRSNVQTELPPFRPEDGFPRQFIRAIST